MAMFLREMPEGRLLELLIRRRLMETLSHRRDVFGNSTWRTCSGAYLIVLAEVIRAELVPRSRVQWHVCGDASQANARSEMPADQRAVLAKCSQS